MIFVEDKKLLTLVHLSYALSLLCFPLLGCERNREDRQMNATFRQLANEFLDYWMKDRPSFASNLGFHEFDGQVEDLTRESILNRTARLKSFLERFETIDPQKLSKADEFDFVIIINRIRSEVLSLEEIRDWERNPMFYVRFLDVSRYVKRDYAPLEERLRSLIRHQEQFASILQAAKKNLQKRAPQTFHETAIRMLEGTAFFLERELPRALAAVADDSLMKTFRRTNKKAIREVREFTGHLKKEVLPSPRETFAIGKEKFERMLLFREMITTPLDSLLVMGLEELRKTKEEFARTAVLVNPHKPATEVFKEIQSEHPKADRLIPEGAATLDDLREFILQRGVVSLPTSINCTVKETPVFLRAISFASLDGPGPFETKATEAFYYITPVEKEWSKKKQQEWLSAFNYQTLRAVSIHEAYPGHYTDLLHLRDVKSKVAKMFSSYSRVEGWAHYAEQMMLDEGYRDYDPKLRLGQLNEALLRLSRYVVSIKLHTDGMTVEEATKFFMENAYYEELPARQEAYRGTFDPGYLNYSLGKIQILALREEYRKKAGKNFSLKDFHDNFLSYGLAPIPLTRRMMLEN